MSNDQNESRVKRRITAGQLVAERIEDDLAWGEGAIQPLPAYATDGDQQALIEAVLQSIEPVTEDERRYSACTDGRFPVRLKSGEPIPVREQLVGADMVSAFFVAELLGPQFYKIPDAPVAERVRQVAQFLRQHGLEPSSHVACGAADGFAAIVQNIQRFGQDQRFVNRQWELLPAEVFSPERYQAVLAKVSSNLKPGQYDGLSAETFLEVVEATSGQRAIAELRDDGRGVRGHVEEAIVRLHTPGLALNEAKLAERTGGREVFGVNDDRIKKLARLFGQDDNETYKKASLALELFADAGHGTLAKNLPTWVLRIYPKTSVSGLKTA